MTSPLAVALEYARRGWRVFPVHGIHAGRCTCGRRDCSSPGKHPLARRGVRHATDAPDVIRGWWRRWRGANVGVATGRVSGIVVIDVDVPEGGASLQRLQDAGFEVPKTLSATTGSGGRHLYLTARDEPLRNAVSSLPGVKGGLRGIDLRADGGYVLAPPSLHVAGRRYVWDDATAVPAVVPEWLRQPPRPAVVSAVVPATFSGDGSAYGLAVLSRELDRLRAARKGARNHTLNRAAFAVARVVAGGELLESAARSALLSAAAIAGLTEHESQLTIDSAFAAGSRRPRSAPHRVRP